MKTLEKRNSGNTTQILLAVFVVLAMFIVIFFLDWTFLLTLIPAVAIVGGIIAFLKLKSARSKALGLALAGLAVIWLFFLPMLQLTIFRR